MKLFVSVLFIITIHYGSCYPAVQLDVSFKDCTPKEIVITQGKCSLYVNSLMDLVAHDTIPELVSQEEKDDITEACHKVLNCYGGLQCKEAEHSKSIYERMCEKMEFEHSDMSRCMSSFNQKVYKKNDSCTVEFDYFSTDMREKRDAYTSGKSCLLDHANQSCSDKSVEYLKKNYDGLLNILTVASENKCSSFHDEMLFRECEPHLNDVLNSYADVAFSFISKTNSSVKSACSIANECLANRCYKQSNMTSKLDGMCQEMDKKLEGHAYVSCKIQIMMGTLDSSEPDLNYECMEKYGPKPKTSDERRSEAGKRYLSFVEDKECMRTIMTGECGEESVKDFDVEWKNDEDEIAAMNQTQHLR